MPLSQIRIGHSSWSLIYAMRKPGLKVTWPRNHDPSKLRRRDRACCASLQTSCRRGSKVVRSGIPHNTTDKKSSQKIDAGRECLALAEAHASPKTNWHTYAKRINPHAKRSDGNQGSHGAHQKDTKSPGSLLPTEC